MPNTFLNTGRVMQATSNPQTNLQQVTNNNQVPSAAPQPNQQVTQTNNGMSPITIPIQIQPITPTQGIAPVSNDNLQSISTNKVNSAPTPQVYEANSTNSNVVDFNQIYNSYQKQFNNNQNSNNVGTSGIKKTTIGTTIVTPTANPNTAKGQYQSAYSDTVNGLISSMLERLSQLESGSFYDPTKDTALQVATEYAANSTLQSLAGSGVLNSSATAERVARIVSELIPQYEQKAYDRQLDFLGQLANTAQLVMDMDTQQFQYWKDAKDREFQEKEFDFNKKMKELENAWKRVDELGYVDNSASALLGVKVGTLSKEAREAKEQREFELKKMQEQAQLEYENNKALYELRAELDRQQSQLEFEYDKQLQQLQNQLNRQNKEYDYQLSQKYGSSSSSSNNNYEVYDEIIKNRYAQYDDFTKQYTVPDMQTYNELASYLDGLYASGQITQSEFLKLSAKYSTYSSNMNIDEDENIDKSNSSATTTKQESNKKESNFWKSFQRSLGLAGALSTLGSSK